MRLTPEQAAQYAKFESLQQEAMEFKDQGKLHEAADKAKEAIPFAESVLGPVNPQSYYAWDWIAGLLTDDGDLPGAFDARTHALALAEKLYANQPWLIADAKIGLGHAERMARLTADQRNRLRQATSDLVKMWRLSSQGDFKAAIEAGAPALKIRSELLGDNDVDTFEGQFLAARVLYDARQFDAAIRLFQAHLQAVQAACGEIHSRTSGAYGWIGSAYKELGDTQQAVAYLAKSLAISRQVRSPDDPQLGDDISQAAQAYLDAGDSPHALGLFDESLKLVERLGGKNSVDYAKSLTNLGAVLSDLERNHEARERYEEAIVVLEKIPETEPDRNYAYSATLSNLGALCRDTGDVQEAQRRLTQALDFCRSHDSEGLGEAVPAVLDQLALTEAEFADWSNAFAHAEEGLELARKRWGDEHPTTLTILHDLGELFWRTGRLSVARVNLELVMRRRITALGDKHELVARSLSELAFLLSELGDMEQAAEYAELSIQVARTGSGEDSDVLAFCYQNAALLMQDLGQDLPKALELMEKSLAVRLQLKGESHPDVAQAYGNLASLYQANGQYDKAQECFRKDLEIEEKNYGESSAQTLTTTFNLGAVCRSRGDFAQAFEYFDKAAKIAEAQLPSTHPYVATCLAHRGACLAQLSRFDEAWSSFRKGFSLRQAMFDEQLPDMSAAQMGEFASVFRGELDGLLSLPPESTRPGEVATCVLQSKARALSMLCRLQAVERASVDDPDLAQLAANAKTTRELVGRLTINPPRSMTPEELSDELRRLGRDLDRTETQVNLRLAQRLGATSTVPGVTSVSAALPAGAALVEFIQYLPTDYSSQEPGIVTRAPRYAAFVLHAGDAKRVERIDLGESEPIDESVKEIVRQIDAARDWYRQGKLVEDESNLETEYKTAAKKLADLVFAPLAKTLGDVRQVYLALDGELFSVPFESLVGSDGNYLVEAGYRFAYLTSGREMLSPTFAPGRGTAIFAAPNYDFSRRSGPRAPARAGNVEPPRNERSPMTRGLHWDIHPGFAIEGNEAAKTMNRGDFAPVAEYVGDEALEETLKATKSIRALVLVTHGFFLEQPKLNPLVDAELLGAETRGNATAAQSLGRLRRSTNPLLRSGLVLAGANRPGDDAASSGGSQPEAEPVPQAVEDGWVTANEIAGLNLQGVQLAVLSACNSSREAGGADAISGLRTAFLAAGVRAIVGSLFEVPDAETAELMKIFYGDLANGKSALESLANAEKSMIKNRRQAHGAAHPFFWASFVVAGRP